MPPDLPTPLIWRCGHDSEAHSFTFFITNSMYPRHIHPLRNHAMIVPHAISRTVSVSRDGTNRRDRLAVIFDNLSFLQTRPGQARFPQIHVFYVF